MTFGLHRSFQPQEDYAPSPGRGYRLLPLRFLRLDSSRYVVTNLAGEHAVLGSGELRDLIEHRLRPDEERGGLYESLKARHFLSDGDSDVHLDLLAAKYRSKLDPLANFTGLHLFVVTLRCEHSCRYCQVSRVSQDRAAFDMDEATAERAVDLMFRSPSPTLKVEFQGGESLLNFPLIRRIVALVDERNLRLAQEGRGRSVQFVITSNLALLNDEVLDFCSGRHDVYFSTSLDGPAELHNHNRPRPGLDSHARTVEGIKRVRERLGPDHVSALMTSTAESLRQPEAIIDEYARLGFRSIFLRPISPYGFAAKTAARTGYETAEFIDFYKRGLDYILDLNGRGVPMREEYSALILRKMLTPFPTAYVDLQSPAGLGIGAIVYNYDGDVYASDEGRMLAEMGDCAFRLGNVHDHSFEQLFLEGTLLDTLHATMAEGVPGCCDCAFLPWCGTDPVYHHRTQGDVMGHRPTSGFCARNMAVMRHLVALLADDPAASRFLHDWAY
jgi:uncharacterized protein